MKKVFLLVVLLLNCLWVSNASAETMVLGASQPVYFSASTSRNSDIQGNIKVSLGLKMLDSKTWKFGSVDMSTQPAVGFSGEVGGMVRGYLGYEVSALSKEVTTSYTYYGSYYSGCYYGCTYYSTDTLSGSTSELDLGVKFVSAARASSGVYGSFGIAKITNTLTWSSGGTNSMDGQGFYALIGASGGNGRSPVIYGVDLKYSTAKKDNWELGGLSLTGAIGMQF